MITRLEQIWNNIPIAKSAVLSYAVDKTKYTLWSDGPVVRIIFRIRFKMMTHLLRIFITIFIKKAQALSRSVYILRRNALD